MVEDTERVMGWGFFKTLQDKIKQSYKNPKVRKVVISFTWTAVVIVSFGLGVLAALKYHGSFDWKIFLTIVAAAALYSIADEVHLIAPLGKILKNKYDKTSGLEDMVKTFNRNLAYYEIAKNESEKPYRLIMPSILDRELRNADDNNTLGSRQVTQSAWIEKTVLVTTSRSGNDDVFKPHFTGLLQLKNFEPSITDMKEGKGPYLWLTPFEGLNIPQRRQIRENIPHDHLRKKHLADAYFEIDGDLNYLFEGEGHHH